MSIQFKKILTKYNKKYLFSKNINSHCNPKKSFYNFFIIIPSYSEEAYLEHTLESISKQKASILDKTLVVVVINNSVEDKLIIKNNNKRTYDKILKINFNFELVILDYFSPRFSLPANLSGVGMARKIGMDFCINYSNENSLLCSIDADTLLNDKYLEIINQEYLKYNFNAAVVNFRHQYSSDKDIQKAILEYEKILKNIAKNLQLIGSRYGFVNMGSTIICKMYAYLVIGGMPSKKATEDFYFLQKLAKYSPVHNIKDVLVYPSSRSEQRVYLGTGFRMNNIKKNIFFDDLYINPKAYNEIAEFYKIMEKKWNYKSSEIMSSLVKKNSKLWCYLEQNNFVNTINKIQKNKTDKVYVIEQFNRWFDSLKIYKFLKSYDK